MSAGAPASARARRTIVVSGMMAGDPHHGGATWAVLQYVLGLRRLGHEVVFVEPVSESALRPSGAPLGASENAAYFRRVARAFGLRDTAALLLAGTEETVGPPYAVLRRAAARADLLINVSGMLTDERLIGDVPIRVYLDLDPAFIQLWHATQGVDMRFDGHTHFVTVGQAVGRPECPVPTAGRTWIATWQPVVLEEWPQATHIENDALTTVASWRGYGSIEYEGVQYGQKAHSLRPLMDLPTRTDERFQLALSIHPDERRDLDALTANGWGLLDPRVVAGTPEAYRRFIQGSKAELGIAKSGYVAARCGWFSDRSACYLASGRPVIAQETGFSSFLGVGEGVLAFQDAEGVLGAIEALRQDYARHARAARQIAVEVFDSGVVLSRLLDRVGA